MTVDKHAERRALLRLCDPIAPDISGAPLTLEVYALPPADSFRSLIDIDMNDVAMLSSSRRYMGRLLTGYNAIITPSAVGLSFVCTLGVYEAEDAAHESADIAQFILGTMELDRSALALHRVQDGRTNELFNVSSERALSPVVEV